MPSGPSATARATRQQGAASPRRQKPSEQVSKSADAPPQGGDAAVRTPKRSGVRTPRPDSGRVAGSERDESCESVRAVSMNALKDLERARADERAAQARAAYVRTVLSRTQVRETISAQTARRQAAAMEYKANVVHGAKQKVAGVVPAPKEAVVELSVRLNRAMGRAIVDPAARSWFKLFMKMDDAGSGHIAIDEMLELVRTELCIGAETLTDEAVTAVFAAIDAEGTGYLSAGEWGKFMRLGEAELRRMEPSATWKERLHQRKHAEGAAVKAELTALNHGELPCMGPAAQRPAEAAIGPTEPASDEAVVKMAERLGARMRHLYPERDGGFFWIFRLADTDGSGRVTCNEMFHTLRTQLEMSKHELPAAAFWSVWQTLDSADLGYLTAGKFLRWIRRGESRPTSARRPESARITPGSGARATRICEVRRIASQRVRLSIEEKVAVRARELLEESQVAAQRYAEEIAANEARLAKNSGSPGTLARRDLGQTWSKSPRDSPTNLGIMSDHLPKKHFEAAKQRLPFIS